MDEFQNFCDHTGLPTRGSVFAIIATHIKRFFNRQLHGRTHAIQSTMHGRTHASIQSRRKHKSNSYERLGTIFIPIRDCQISRLRNIDKFLKISWITPSLIRSTRLPQSRCRKAASLLVHLERQTTRSIAYAIDKRSISVELSLEQLGFLSFDLNT